MSYQTSSKRSTPFCLLIGARKTQVFWHQSEARTAATVWNWTGKTLSPGAFPAILYFSFVPYFSARFDFPSPPLSAPGSPRMPLPQPLRKAWYLGQLHDLLQMKKIGHAQKSKFHFWIYKSDTSALTFPFRFLASPLISLFLLHLFFSFAGHLVGFILVRITFLEKPSQK